MPLYATRKYYRMQFGSNFTYLDVLIFTYLNTLAQHKAIIPFFFTFAHAKITPLLWDCLEFVCGYSQFIHEVLTRSHLLLTR